MSEKATFGAGCFWKPEYVFRQVDGVVSTSVGYMGGETANPRYEQVCTGRTGHAENFVRIALPAPDPSHIGRIVPVAITGQSGDMLTAEIET